MSQMHLQIIDEDAMELLGARISSKIPAGSIIYLQGDLGTGKTTLVRGFLRALGHQGAVKSPTFTVVEPYSINANKIYHFDLYRLADPEELEFLGIRDYLDGYSIALIEWPDKGKGVLPAADLTIKISHRKSAREVELIPQSQNGANITSFMATQYHLDGNKNS